MKISILLGVLVLLGSMIAFMGIYSTRSASGGASFPIPAVAIAVGILLLLVLALSRNH